MNHAEPKYAPSMVALAVVAMYGAVALLARWSPDQERLLALLLVTVSCFIWLYMSRSYWSLFFIGSILGVLLGYIAYPMLKGTLDYRVWLPALIGLVLVAVFLSQPFRALARRRDETSRPGWMKGGSPPSE